MKKGLLIVLLALTVGVAAFFITRSYTQTGRSGVLLDSMPELAWLRRDLDLDDAEFAAASELHAAYRPVCVEMCAHISEAHAKLERLAKSSHGMNPELAEAIREHARVHAECQQRMIEHLYRTAALFDEKQADEYLRMMIPAALDSVAGDAPETHDDHNH